MVEIGKNTVKTAPSGAPCSVNARLGINNPLKNRLIRDIVKDVLTDGAQIKSATNTSVDLELGDRIWTRRPYMFLEHLRVELALENVGESGIGTEDAMDVAVENSSGRVFSTGDTESELLVEMGFARKMIPSEFEERWSSHILRPESLNEHFPSVEEINETSYLFTGQTGDVSIDGLQNSIDAFKEDFPVADSVLTCRPI